MSFYYLDLLNSVCDFYYSFPNCDGDEKSFKFPELKDKKQVFPNAVIYGTNYIHTRYNIFTEINVPFILITGKTDYTIPYFEFDNPNNIGFKILQNPNLIAWYGNNTDSNHPKLITVPLELPRCIPWIESNYVAWYRNYCHFHVIQGLKHLPKDKESFKLPKKNLLYCKMTIGNSDNGFTLTRYKNIRKIFINDLESRFSIDKNLVCWQDYIKELVTHKFCLSLPGRGIDCFRTWESLHLGVIPVVLDTSINKIYENLPVIIVKNSSDITEEFLNKEYDKIISNLDSYDWPKLTLDYWVNKILNNSSN